jgi:hypothetical protein
MNQNIIKEPIIGARNISSFFIMLILFCAGLSFFLVGLSSYLNINLIKLTDTSKMANQNVPIDEMVTSLEQNTLTSGLTLRSSRS